MVYVIKADGRREPFSEEKLERTLRRVGAPKELWPVVLEKVRTSLYDGMSTKEIYRILMGELRRLEHPSSERMRLKEAMMFLGPAGFAFEAFMAEIFKSMGYEVELNPILDGRCAIHEIDLLLEGTEIVECKYHNQPGIYTGLKEAMYTEMRAIDLKDGRFDVKRVWLVTNTRFSEEAKRFANCRGMMLLGWRVPEGEGLEEIIEKHKLYPITMLTSLTQEEFETLRSQGFLTLRNLVERKVVGIGSKRLRELRKRAREILEG